MGSPTPGGASCASSVPVPGSSVNGLWDQAAHATQAPGPTAAYEESVRCGRDQSASALDSLWAPPASHSPSTVGSVLMISTGAPQVVAVDRCAASATEMSNLHPILWASRCFLQPFTRLYPSIDSRRVNRSVCQTCVRAAPPLNKTAATCLPPSCAASASPWTLNCRSITTATAASPVARGLPSST